MDRGTDLCWLHGIKLANEEPLIADPLQTLIEDRDHLVGVCTVDVAQPVVNLGRERFVITARSKEMLVRLMRTVMV